MGLADLVSLVDDVVLAQVAPAPQPEVRFLGPTLTSAERGRGIRPLDSYARSLRAVQPGLSRSGLAGRIRHMLFPGKPSFAGLFTTTGAVGWPEWYGGSTPVDVDRSVALDVLARTGYLTHDRLGERQVVAVRRFWPAADHGHFHMGSWMSLVASTLFVGEPEPPELKDPFDFLTWAGGLAQAWMDWHAWRVAYHAGRPASEWAANELGPLEPGPVRRALARSFPLEELRGALDGLVLGKRSLVEPTAAAMPWADMLQEYYAPVPAGGGPHVADRISLFLEASSTFHALFAAGDLLESALQGVARPATAAAVTRTLSMVGDAALIERAQLSPWGQASVELLADQFAAFVAGTVGPLGPWPDAGYGARTIGPAGAVQRLYGGFDLQFGDDDANQRYGGALRAADAGDRVAELVADLATLGFTAPAAGTTAFDPRVAMAVREFQIEAAQSQVSAERDGARGAHPQLRRYLGEIHGVVDAETRRTLQIWLGLPRVVGDPAELLAGGRLTNPRNGLQVVACASTNTPGPSASQVVAGNLWGPNGTPVGGVDGFDFAIENRRHWAVDVLLRWGTPVAAEMPTLADFGGAAVPLQNVDVVPLGRFDTAGPDAFDIGGPQNTRTDHWSSTELTLARFLLGARADLPAREADWRVVYGFTEPETWGFSDVVNAWDPAMLSFGWCHWTLVLLGGDGEMGAFLAWYRRRDAQGFRRDFGSWGVNAVEWAATTRISPGKYTAPVRVFGVRDAGVAGTVVPEEPTAADAYLNHTWLRSWRTIYRAQQALRRSPAMAAANREFAVRRVWEVLANRWTGAAAFSDADTTWGDLFTSEAAIVALMRWHINRPNDVYSNAAGNPDNFVSAIVNAAVVDCRAATPNVGPRIATASLRLPADAGAVAFQERLIDELVNPAVDVNGTVRAATALAVRPGGVALSRAPGSYPGPLAIP